MTSANPRDNLDTDKHKPYPETVIRRGTGMLESGRTWRKDFKGDAREAAHVRLWTTGRVTHPDAPTVANELYIGVLSSGSPAIEMTLSTAGTRIRITAKGSSSLLLHHSHGPGWRIVTGLSTEAGLTTDGRGVWALMEAGR
ncbi:hypothetical protein [Streptomyces albogriseolus]|uniref:hypothetical protein n=1 Tax=Streptomyces albogriseolus TaxID=1887 RepID=UPI00224D3306|nr:hypothetical protein [Streptomyces viridodiastaticus]MCX4622769.1 hypothetical protein [Streptomyces viridodiastaticus]